PPPAVRSFGGAADAEGTGVGGIVKPGSGVAPRGCGPTGEAPSFRGLPVGAGAARPNPPPPGVDAERMGRHLRSLARNPSAVCTNTSVQAWLMLPNMAWLVT